MGVRPGAVTYRRQRNNAPVICDTVAHASRHDFVDPRDTGKYIYRHPGWLTWGDLRTQPVHRRKLRCAVVARWLDAR